MPRGKHAKRIITFALLGALGAYICAAVWQALANPLATTMAVAYTHESVIKSDGLIIRDELLLDGYTDSVSHLLEDGKRAAKGETVALICSDELTPHALARMAELESDIALIKEVLREEMTTAQALTVSERISDAVMDLSSCVNTDNLGRLPEIKLQLKKLLLHRDKVFHDTDELDALLESYQKEYDLLSKQVESTTTGIVSPASGIYSHRADGFEKLLSPSNLTALSAGLLEDLRSDAPQEAEHQAKIACGLNWYYACALDSSDCLSLKEGDRLTLRFDGAKDIPAKIHSIGQNESGRRLVIFSCSTGLESTINLRITSASIITESYTGIRIPQKAWRVLEDGRQGVYCLSGLQAEFKPCEILCQYEGYYIVRYDSSAGRGIRPGNEVITAGRDLYDGKVVK